MFTKERKHLFLIIITFIAACIETDIYLPAFTDMMVYFSVSEEAIQSLLTWNFFGVCIAGPLYGPISDAVGRKNPLVFALGLFLIGSLITLFADSFTLMLIGRILQGIGSGGCFTLGTAIIFDAFQQEKAIFALNKINTIVPIIMAGAPMLGGYLNQVYGFRSNFLAITICVLLSFLICLFFFDETLPKEKRVPFQWKKLIRDFKTVTFSVPFWQSTTIVCFMFAGYLAFLSTISVLYVIELGVNKQALPFHQMALLGSWVGANLCFKRCLATWGVVTIKKIGTLLFVIGGITFFVSCWVDPENVYLFTGAMSLYAIGANWINSIYFPEGMELFPEIKGITASLLTSARLLIAACVVGLSSYLYNFTIYPIAAIVFGLTLIILSIIIFYERNRKDTLVVNRSTFIMEH